MSSINKITYATQMFDFWSIVHWGMFAFIASSIAAKWEPKLRWHLLIGLVIGYGWEVAEWFLSRHYPAAWSYRLESVLNSFVGDIISDLAGVVFGWFVVAYYRKRYVF
jgi:hypothetical protein